MIIKEKFSLLKDTPNILNMPAAAIKKISVDNGPRKISSILEMMQSKMSHYTKNKVIQTVFDPDILKKQLHVIVLPTYNIPISYNKPTKGLVINLHALGTDDIYPTNPDPNNIYACMVYAICFRELVSGDKKLSPQFYQVFSSYLTSIFVRVFGKDYGLLGTFSSEISKLTFLTACYILNSFFGIEGVEMFKKAGEFSPAFKYKDFMDVLQKYNFYNITDFILALSELKVMPGINKYIFTSKLFRFLGINFIPALEDCARFISVITTSNIKSSNIVPTFIYTYNEEEYSKILTISKTIFK